MLEKIDLDPIILSKQANQGCTIIEKLESNADVSSAIILLTSDNIGREKMKLQKNHTHDKMLYLKLVILLAD